MSEESKMAIAALHDPPSATDASDVLALPLFVRDEELDIILHGPGDNVATVRVNLLTRRSSQRMSHMHATPYAAPGQKCRACRWIEVLLARTVDGDYVVQTVGMSTVPGETNNYYVVRARDPYALLEDLVVHKTSTNQRFMPRQTAEVFDDFSDLDPVISNAFDDWAERNAQLLLQ